MKLLVHQHKIDIIKDKFVNEKEINISKCEFEFDEEITDEFIKDVYFTLNDKTYIIANIQNNECNFPSEVLVEKGTVKIGVVAYLVDNEEEIKRYNPSPVYFSTLDGSLVENAENTEPITPTDKEQLWSAINSKQAQLISGVNIKTINDESILGEGNIEIKGGGSVIPTVENEELIFEKNSGAYVLEEELILG